MKYLADAREPYIIVDDGKPEISDVVDAAEEFASFLNEALPGHTVEVPEGGLQSLYGDLVNIKRGGEVQYRAYVVPHKVIIRRLGFDGIHPGDRAKFREYIGEPLEEVVLGDFGKVYKRSEVSEGHEKDSVPVGTTIDNVCV